MGGLSKNYLLNEKKFPKKVDNSDLRHYFLRTIPARLYFFIWNKEQYMKLKILWPGKTHNRDIRCLQEFYLTKINRLEKCDLIETKEAKGIAEKFEKKIKTIEADGLEKYFKDDYIICLHDKGKEMNSDEFSRFLEKITANSRRTITFVIGGFLGLEERLIKKADFLLSLSRMTFSHELSRAVLLEQIYRSLAILKGRKYAK